MTATPSLANAATPPTAIGIVLLSCAVFSVLDASAKYLVVSGMNPGFVTWVRFAVHVVLVLVLFRAWSDRSLFLARSLPMQVLRGVFLFGSTIFNFIALRTLPLADAMAIYFFAPMVITALAGPLLGEWAGWRRWVAIGIGLIGILVVTRPGFEAFTTGHVLAMLSMLSYSLYVIMTRHMGATESAGSLIFYSALTPAIFMAPVAVVGASMPPSAVHWVLLLLLGVFGSFGHWLVIKAYKLASPSALAPYPYIQLVFAVMWGYLIFDDLPDFYTLLGSGIIILSGLYIVHRERQLRLASMSGPNAEDRELAKTL